jgi:hypothetical protein
MGVRPPANDVDDERDAIEFGIAALDARLEDRNVAFPATKTDLQAAHGNIRVAVSPGGSKITLTEALDEVEQDSFDSRQELLNALHPVFEQKRERLSGGVLGWLRSLLPF